MGNSKTINSKELCFAYGDKSDKCRILESPYDDVPLDCSKCAFFKTNVDYYSESVYYYDKLYNEHPEQFKKYYGTRGKKRRAS